MGPRNRRYRRARAGQRGGGVTRVVDSEAVNGVPHLLCGAGCGRPIHRAQSCVCVTEPEVDEWCPCEGAEWSWLVGDEIRCPCGATSSIRVCRELNYAYSVAS